MRTATCLCLGVVMTCFWGSGCSERDPASSHDGAPAAERGVGLEAGSDKAVPDRGPSTDGASDTSSPCGNGVVEGNEKCDRGKLNSKLPDAPCRPDCTLPRCGDGVKDSSEQCDDGNTKGGDGCSATCTLDSASKLVAQPAALHFGVFGLGCDAPRSLSLVLFNPTQASIQLSAVTKVGCSSELSLVPPVAPGAVAPGGSTTVQAKFSPAQQGTTSCILKVSASDGLLMVPVTAAVKPKSSQTDTFLQQLNRKVDILFVVDPSGSMFEEIAKLKATAPTFASSAASNKLDFQLGAVSLVPGSSSTSLLGKLEGDPRYITASTPSLQAEFQERFDMPSASGGTETGFDAILAALSASLGGTVSSSCSGCSLPNVCVSGACRGPNWGFRRSSASLEILFFSDEDDQSTASVQQTLTFLKGMVNPLLGQFVRVHGLLPSASCSSGVSFPRWQSVIKSTGGVQSDLCAASYVPAIQKLTDRMFGLQDQFFLTRTPDATSITVLVDGKATTAFSYDASSNSIKLTTPPKDGAVVGISYTVSCP